MSTICKEDEIRTYTLKRPAQRVTHGWCSVNGRDGYHDGCGRPCFKRALEFAEWLKVLPWESRVRNTPALQGKQRMCSARVRAPVSNPQQQQPR